MTQIITLVTITGVTGRGISSTLSVSPLGSPDGGALLAVCPTVVERSGDSRLSSESLPSDDEGAKSRC